MSEIKEAIKKLYNVQKEFETLDNYAFDQFRKMHENSKIKICRVYGGFEVISENEIRIRYDYGIDEEEYKESFIVKLK